MMKKVVLAVATLAASALGAARDVHDYKGNFAEWINKYNKNYAAAEFHHRFSTFCSNLDYVTKFNSETSHHGSMTLAMNMFADLTSEEFANMYTGLNYNHEDEKLKVKNTIEFGSDVSVPDTIDWRTQGAVTPVKNQGQCGSCWSFSTTGSTEGAWKLAGHTLVGLSEQNLMDCSTSQGNQGCNGGLMDNAFKYIIANKGIDSESSYPYKGQDGTCAFNAANVAATISSFVDIPTKNETALQAAVGTVGPVSVAIDAGQITFQLYHAGVYHSLLCSQTRLDHGVLAVGYGADGADDYWIVKNSWGAEWGQQGYIWMSRNKNNNCGIATSASYPKV